MYKDGYKWSIIDKSNTGIDFDSITAITRDGNGNLWVGWKSGLASYNGSSWQKAVEFDGLRVTSIAVEGIGNVIVGIKGELGGIAVLHDKDWIFYTTTNSAIPSGNINSLLSDHDQALWMATSDKGIIRYKNNEWESMSIEIPLLSQDFNSITMAPDGSIWAGSTASQLIHFHDNTFTLFTTGASKPITSVLVAGAETVWCSTFGAGLIKFDGSGWTSYTISNAKLQTNDIFCLAKFDAGNLIFSIPGGKVLLIKN